MEYTSDDALGWAERLRRREVSARELVTAAAARIDACNDRLNAVIHRLDPFEALANLRTDDDAPFAGVPFLFKDELDVAGLPMTMGSKLLRGFRSQESHPVAQRILAAGFVPIGRTNMSELGLVPTTEPRAYGPTRNPYDFDTSPGGSSGGAAAAVAAGMVPVAHAADGGGSIRIPASACGLVGLKPSRGWHPLAPLDPPQGFVVQGCVSRTVRDSAAFLEVIHGDSESGRRLRGPELRLDSEPQGKLRFAYDVTGVLGNRAHPDVRRAVEDTAHVLEALGHSVELARPPLHSEDFAKAFRVLWCTAAGVFFRRVHQLLLQKAPEWSRRFLDNDQLFRTAVALPGRVEPFTLRMARWQDRLTPVDLWMAELEFAKAAETMRHWFERYDVWLLPTLMRPPIGLGELDLRGTEDQVERMLLEYVGWMPLANATGIPAISVPSTPSEKGLPIGVQMMGPWGREDRLLSVAAQLERERPWPGIASV